MTEEFISATWTVNGHRVPFKARLQFVGPRTEVCDDLAQVEARPDRPAIGRCCALWLRRATEEDADALRRDLQRAACDAYNLMRWRERDGRGGS